MLRFVVVDGHDFGLIFNYVDGLWPMSNTSQSRIKTFNELVGQPIYLISRVQP